MGFLGNINTKFREFCEKNHKSIMLFLAVMSLLVSVAVFIIGPGLYFTITDNISGAEQGGPVDAGVDSSREGEVSDTKGIEEEEGGGREANESRDVKGIGIGVFGLAEEEVEAEDLGVDDGSLLDGPKWRRVTKDDFSFIGTEVKGRKWEMVREIESELKKSGLLCAGCRIIDARYDPSTSVAEPPFVVFIRYESPRDDGGSDYPEGYFTFN